MITLKFPQGHIKPPSPTKSSNSKAFTLAETLITLTIIGVIAAMTISSLTQNVTKTILETGYKKSYQTFTNIMTMSQIAGVQLSDWNWKKAYTDEDYEEFAKQYILPHLKIVKNCKRESGQGCFYGGYYKLLNKTTWANNLDSELFYKFITADGQSWGLRLITDCVEKKTYCAFIRVDVNGRKGPNTYGRDIFTYELYPLTNRFVPEGIYILHSSINENTQSYDHTPKEDIDANCNKAGGTRVGDSPAGGMCGAKLVLEGFKMNY